MTMGKLFESRVYTPFIKSKSSVFRSWKEVCKARLLWIYVPTSELHNTVLSKHLL